jgi:hypothetical protein
MLGTQKTPVSHLPERLFSVYISNNYGICRLGNLTEVPTDEKATQETGF